MCYHLTRKPISVVKSVLHRNCTALNRPSNYVLIEGTNESTWCDYPPFGESSFFILCLHFLIYIVSSFDPNFEDLHLFEINN